MNPPDRPRKQVRFDLCDKQINGDDTDERVDYFSPVIQINADFSPSLTPSASPVSSDGSVLTPPIQGLPPVHSNNRKSFEEEQETHAGHAKIVLCPSMTQRKYAEWNTLTEPEHAMKRSSLELPAIYQTGDPRTISLKHDLIPVKILLQSQNMGCIKHGDVYRALYSALQTRVAGEYILALSEDTRDSIYHSHRARCLELPEAQQDDELTRGPKTIDLLLGKRTFIGLKRSDKEDELEILFH
jgi:hypothetical protein